MIGNTREQSTTTNWYSINLSPIYSTKYSSTSPLHVITLFVSIVRFEKSINKKKKPNRGENKREGKKNTDIIVEPIF